MNISKDKLLKWLGVIEKVLQKSFLPGKLGYQLGQVRDDIIEALGEDAPIDLKWVR